jgi:hypothetical protein
MRIVVLPEDIRWGVQGDSHFCPVARAIRREVPARVIAVGHRRVSIWIDHPDLMTNTAADKVIEFPQVIGEIIARFDADGKMDPFGFEL